MPSGDCAESYAKPGRGPCTGSSGLARPVGSSFSPLNQKLPLGTEGYRPAVLRLIVRQAGTAGGREESTQRSGPNTSQDGGAQAEATSPPAQGQPEPAAGEAGADGRGEQGQQ